MHGGKSRYGYAHPRFKHGRHLASLPFTGTVVLCPKCRKYETPAEHERRERARSALYLRGYMMGCKLGYQERYDAGFDAGQDAAYKKMARRARN
jgi:hypothetical protein